MDRLEGVVFWVIDAVLVVTSFIACVFLCLGIITLGIILVSFLS